MSRVMRMRARRPDPTHVLASLYGNHRQSKGANLSQNHVMLNRIDREPGKQAWIGASDVYGVFWREWKVQSEHSEVQDLQRVNIVVFQYLHSAISRWTVENVRYTTGLSRICHHSRKI